VLLRHAALPETHGDAAGDLVRVLAGIPHLRDGAHSADLLLPDFDRLGYPDPPPEAAQQKLAQAAQLQQEAAQIIAAAAVQPFIPIQPEATEDD
jgi:hypothetical protein